MGISRPKLLVTRKLLPEIESQIRRDYRARFNSDDTLWSADQLVDAARDMDGLLVSPTDAIDRHLIMRLPDSVGIIATYSVGFDHIDVSAASERAITITNTPDANTIATADITMLLLLGAARGAGWGGKMMRDGSWRSWAPIGPLGVDLAGKRLGILGMGRIGRAVAQRARAFDMHILYHNRKRLAPELETNAEYVADLDTFLAQCDYLSLHVGLNDATRGLINAERIASLPDGAILINSARGDIIDEDALMSALKSGKLAAVGLDVYRNEPHFDRRLLDFPNAFLLPHLGSSTFETRLAMGDRALSNLAQFFAGGRPQDLIASG